MNFEEFVRSNKKSVYLIAGELGVSLGTLYNYINGETFPSIERAIHIEKYSKGKVKIGSWLRAKKKSDKSRS